MLLRDHFGIRVNKETQMSVASKAKVVFLDVAQAEYWGGQNEENKSVTKM